MVTTNKISRKFTHPKWPSDGVCDVNVAVLIEFLDVLTIVRIPLQTVNETEVLERYGFVPETIMFLVSLMKDQLIYYCHRNDPLAPLYEVLVTHRYFATGSFYITIEDKLLVSESSAGRAVRRETDLLCHHFMEFFRLPGRDEISSTKNNFHKLAGKFSVCILLTFCPINTPIA